MIHRLSISLFLSLASALLVASSAAENLHPRAWYEAQFVNWMHEFGVEIEGGEEFVQRLQIWADNHDMIEKHNADNFTFSMNHNAYSHLTWSEFKTHMNLGFNMPPRRKVYHQHVAVDTATLPTEVDWAAEGAVTNVKDQGSCGSCWSFSSTGALEGAYKIKLGSLKSFSEQMLVDCDQYDYGCNGGLMDNAFKWVGENGGLCLEDDYAYTSGTTKKEGECASSSCTAVSGSTVTSWADVDTNEDALTSAVAQQPVAVAIEADQLPFQFYSGGVFTGRCGTSLDHGVLAVGYGIYTDGTPYWKVKNSWGDSWGMDGYILLEKGKDQEGGQCGIALGASYPTL